MDFRLVRRDLMLEDRAAEAAIAASGVGCAVSAFVPALVMAIFLSAAPIDGAALAVIQAASVIVEATAIFVVAIPFVLMILPAVFIAWLLGIATLGAPVWWMLHRHGLRGWPVFVFTGAVLPALPFVARGAWALMLDVLVAGAVAGWAMWKVGYRPAAESRASLRTGEASPASIRRKGGG